MTTSTTHAGLTTRQLTLFAAQLRQQHRFRTEQIDALRAAIRPGGRPESAADREVSEVLLRGARDALAEIEAARTRMAVGSYGRCVDCGSRLALERLEVLPSVARCLNCHRATAW